ncbi:MAG TPA: hypothetical protein VK003_16500 [Oceanobacillus sp.]|jgi:hypothetical protein|nr:hypothetical protein [Oceanobacillus sp.]
MSTFVGILLVVVAASTIVGVLYVVMREQHVHEEYYIPPQKPAGQPAEVSSNDETTVVEKPDTQA